MPHVLPPFSLRFAPSFYLEGPQRAVAASPVVTPESAESAAAPRISFAPERYHSPAGFAAHPDFTAFEEQFRQGFETINRFCAEHEMRDREPLRANFETFLTHRFGGNRHYFPESHLDLLDGAGKRAFDELVAMLDDPAFDVEDKKSAVRQLGEEIHMPAPGVASNMLLASRELALSAGGPRAAVWTAKDAIFQAVVGAAVSAEFGRERNFARNEIHCYNAVRNYLGPGIGLPSIEDGFARRDLPRDFLESCRAEVVRALTPGKVALHLAEACHAQAAEVIDHFCARAPAHEESSPAVYRYDRDAQRVIDAALTQARKGYGASVQQRSLVRIEDDFETFCLQPPTLVAVDILQGIDEQKLLEGTPALVATWIDPANGDRVTTMSADRADMTDDSLVWVVRSHDEQDKLAVQDPSGLHGNANTERELFDLRLACQLADRLPVDPVPANHRRVPSSGSERRGAHAASRPLEGIPSQGLTRRVGLQAIGSADPEQLMRFDAASVTRLGMIGPFLSRLGPARFAEYLSANEARFVDLRIDGEARTQWTHCVLAAAAATFAKLRAANGQEPPCLNTVIERLQGLCRVLQSVLGTSAPPRQVQQTLRSLAEAKNDQGVPFLIDAAKYGDHRAINGWVDALHSLGILEQIKDELSFLLDARRSETDMSAMAIACSRRHALVVTALGNAFRSPGILEHIKEDLAMMLMALSGPSLKPALHRAVEHDDPAVIRAWCAVVLSPDILPLVKRYLPAMLSSDYCDGRSALARAAQGGKVRAMRALGEAFRSAALHLPGTFFSESPLHSLLDAPYRGTPLLSEASECGRAEVISTWRDILLSDEILPHIKENLPHMFRALNANGESALRLAALHGRPESIKALGDLFLSPRALPHLKGHLQELLAEGRAIELTLGRGFKYYWPDARWKRDTNALQAYLEVIEKAAPVLTRADINAILSPCRSVFAEPPSRHDSAIRRECLQVFRASGMRIVDASRGAFKAEDVLALSQPGRSD